MCHTWKNGSHLEKWVTLGKMGHTCKNGSHLEKKWVTLLEKWFALEKNGSHLKKWVTLRKVSHPWKNLSHFERNVTLGKMDHT